jgi:hypothetical protein
MVPPLRPPPPPSLPPRPAKPAYGGCASPSQRSRAFAAAPLQARQIYHCGLCFARQTRPRARRTRPPPSRGGRASASGRRPRHSSARPPRHAAARALAPAHQTTWRRLRPAPAALASTRTPGALRQRRESAKPNGRMQSAPAAAALAFGHSAASALEAMPARGECLPAGDSINPGH